VTVMHSGDFNALGPTGKQSGSEDQEEMLEEADRIRHSHPEGAPRRPGLWHRLRAKLSRRH
jgi:hypothetical protein